MDGRDGGRQRTAAEEGWRIDELAHRGGVSVDTLRFYLREGLLPPARRQGRLTLFGPSHLIRLHQIRDLQDRSFSLASIRKLVEQQRLDLVQTLFASGEGAFDRAELIEQSGLGEDQVARLEAVGLIVEPHREGRPAYDAGDLQVLLAVRALLDLGLPEHVVVFLVRTQVTHFEQMLNEIIELFRGAGEWSEEERRAFEQRAPETLEALFPLVQRLLNYTHHRTILRLTVANLGADAPGDPNDEA
jgi:DNA-binding transcriptional MerR regulator